jgi:bifunctional non-homologous end joining protein LigD
VQLVGRSGTDFTARFPEVADALTQVRARWVLDGDLVVVRAGVPSFPGLQGRIHRTRPAAVQAGALAAPALYVAFDLLHTGDQ